MSPTGRAIVDRCVGLQNPSPAIALFQKLWLYVARHYGPQCQDSMPQLRTSVTAQQSLRAFYYDLDEEEKQGGWGSAAKAALGKMEYHIPAAACLTGLAAGRLAESNFSQTLPDNAVKCAIRHFDLRVGQTCAIIVDSTVRRSHVQQKQNATTRTRPMAARVLESCLKDPILESHMSLNFSALKGAHKSTERRALMEELQERGLGDVKESRRRGGGDGCCVEFHRRALSPIVSAALQERVLLAHYSARIAANAWLWPLGVSISFKPEWQYPRWQFALSQAGREGGRSVSWNAWCWETCSCGATARS